MLTGCREINENVEKSMSEEGCRKCPSLSFWSETIHSTSLKWNSSIYSKQGLNGAEDFLILVVLH